MLEPPSGVSRVCEIIKLDSNRLDMIKSTLCFFSVLRSNKKQGCALTQVVGSSPDCLAETDVSGCRILYSHLSRTFCAHVFLCQAVRCREITFGSDTEPLTNTHTCQHHEDLPAGALIEVLILKQSLVLCKHYLK